jgi:hypothetical protein
LVGDGFSSETLLAIWDRGKRAGAGEHSILPFQGFFREAKALSAFTANGSLTPSAATDNSSYLSSSIGPRCLFNVRECVVSAWSPALDGLQKDDGTIEKNKSQVLVAAFQMLALIPAATARCRKARDCVCMEACVERLN